MNKILGKWLFVIAGAAILTGSCAELWGDNKLGDGFSLLEGDTVEDRIIVYCTEDETCYSGIRVVPTYDRQYDKDGRYAEFVKSVQANKKWIVAETIVIKSQQQNYWIIEKNNDIKKADCTILNCDSILQAKVIGPLNLKDCQSKMKQLHIDIDIQQEK